MVGQAKTLAKNEFLWLLDWIKENRKNPVRDRVVMMLSFKSSLRAQEIAGIRWIDVMDAFGKIIPPGKCFRIPPNISKKGNARTIPMHPDLYESLLNYWEDTCVPHDPIIKGERKPFMTPNAMGTMIDRLYKDAGMIGCSSHTGRRSGITEMAQTANEYGCSLVDVQKIAGHKYLSTTEIYIEPSDNVSGLIASM